MCEMFFRKNVRGVELFLGPQQDVSDVVKRILLVSAQQADPTLKMTQDELARLLEKKNCLSLPPHAPFKGQLLARPFSLQRGLHFPISIETTDDANSLQVCRSNGRRRSVEIIRKAFPDICEMTAGTTHPMIVPETIEVHLTL